MPTTSIIFAVVGAPPKAMTRGTSFLDEHDATGTRITGQTRFIWSQAKAHADVQRQADCVVARAKCFPEFQPSIRHDDSVFDVV